MELNFNPFSISKIRKIKLEIEKYNPVKNSEYEVILENKNKRLCSLETHRDVIVYEIHIKKGLFSKRWYHLEGLKIGDIFYYERVKNIYDNL